MIITLLAGVLASSILTTSVPATPAPTEQYSFNPVHYEEGFTRYVVLDGDYLSMIADAFYGNEDYWTNIWNDNPEVKDAAQLEPGTVLKIRKGKTAQPEILKPELAERIAPATPIYTYPSAQASINYAQVQVQQPATQAPPPATAASTGGPLSEEQITTLGSCEAGMDPAKNTGNGYYGAFQFSQGTWNSMNTGYARADQAPIEVQKAAVQQLVSRSSIYTQFPGCARKMQSSGQL